MRILRKLLLIGLVVFVAACGRPKQVRIKEKREPASALVYGQIVLPGEDWRIQHILIQRVGQVYFGGGFAGLGEKIHVMPDGRFVVENLKPGKYMLGGFYMGNTRYMLGEAALDYSLDVKPGRVQYFGAYKYVQVSNGNLIAPGEFDLQKASSKSNQGKLLTWVEESSRGTKWHPSVVKHLKKLGLQVPVIPAAQSANR